MIQSIQITQSEIKKSEVVSFQKLDGDPEGSIEILVDGENRLFNFLCSDNLEMFSSDNPDGFSFSESSGSIEVYSVSEITYEGGEIKVSHELFGELITDQILKNK